MNSLQIRVHTRLVTREKREMRGAQQVVRGMFNELSVAKALNERLGFRATGHKEAYPNQPGQWEQLMVRELA